MIQLYIYFFRFFSITGYYKILNTVLCCCCRVIKSRLTVYDFMDWSTCRLVCPPPSPAVCSDSCSLSWWCYLTMSSSATPFSLCLQYFLAWRSVPLSRLFTAGGQSIGASASALVLPVYIQGWFPLGLMGLISWNSFCVHILSFNLKLLTYPFRHPL